LLKENNNKNKHLVKQSYIILIWFHYLLNIKVSGNKKPKLAFLPTKTKMITLPKAPMAHKDNSKEQFFLKLHFFKVSYCASLKKNQPLAGFNLTLLFFLLAKKNKTSLQTNLFFLKYSSICIYFTDNKFFNLNNI
jgi:hypothetical protein